MIFNFFGFCKRRVQRS